MTAKTKQGASMKSSKSLVDETTDEKKDEKAEIVASSVDSAKEITVAKEQVRKALKALKTHAAKTSSKSLFPEIDQSVQLLVCYKKPALVNNGMKRRIVLPHSDRSIKNTTICLIMPDLDQSASARTDADVSKQSREWAAMIEEEHGITIGEHVSKIINKRQLEREYGSFKQRRDLASAYDLFMVDARVSKSVRNFVGKEFARAHKVPLEFKYDKPLASSIEKTLRTTIFSTRARMPRVAVRCGHLGQPISDLALNVDEVIDSVAQHCPGGFNNVRSLYLQLPSGVPSLCLHMDNGSANDVALTAPEKFKRRKHEIEGELSTLPDGLKVAVLPTGQARVLREDDSLAVYYPTVNDEWEENDDMRPVLNPDKINKKKLKRKALKEKAEAKKNKAKGASLKNIAGLLCSPGDLKEENQEIKEEGEDVKEDIKEEDHDNESDADEAPPVKKVKKTPALKKHPLKMSKQKKGKH
ncbi:unnamed protein product, partial [Mesorhabditis belari]|uniref:Ribosomal L1 domain-containing protein 1 n=1 Tax=Mesorhabditis belari TaxID=2138241 RepID=A0AAF3ELH3_9BILA